MPKTGQPGIEDRWAGGPAGGKGADPLDQLVYLSNLVGAEPRLVQPGGGNTSIKVGDTLLVKGSGTDLRTIGRAGFTHLSLHGLAALRDVQEMDDAAMMRFMTGCMTGPGGPAPSVETPLHSLLPQAVVVHTHDVATMSLTNVRAGVGERLVTELFGDTLIFVPYVRPGFPLARAVRGLVERLSRDVAGMVLAHHGLVVWGGDARECYERLLQVANRIEQYLVERRGGRDPLGARGRTPAAGERRRAAETILPVVRGVLGAARRVVLEFDDGDDLLPRLGAKRLRKLAGRGMGTPEHILRAGRLPLWLDVDAGADAGRLVEAVRAQLARQRADYEAYHARHAAAGEAPLDDWAKVVLVPGIGMITVGGDRRAAVTANLCYRSVLDAIANAEAIDAFEFLSEPDVFEFEHWPLERRKLDERVARERAAHLVFRQVVVVIGGGSGIGQAAARRFVEEGAHVVVADLDAGAAVAVADAIAAGHPGRAVGVGADVRDDASLAGLFERAVREYGGLDCLFYTVGAAPRFAEIANLSRADLQCQLDVHYLGAVLAIGAAARVMRRQGTGGSIVAAVSKAAVAPGRDAAAYGGSKAALLQALRVAALELGKDGIRVNAINADQIDTPLFRAFVRERAARRGVTEEDQLAAYRERNALGASLIPPEAVADLAVMLASDRFRYTSGDILTIDGGLPEAFPR
jgi:rhamnose utilization protein RhaD (predicted bifunctional aldolase and dehydrogenase)/NAD(P)-dependent dehydrogenase (short-subunit alcohol dehydrogenase family)